MANKKRPSVASQRLQSDIMHATEAKALRRRRATIQIAVTGGTLIVGVAAIAAVVLTQRAMNDVVPPSSPPAASVLSLADMPLTIGPDFVRVGATDASVTLSLYEDFSCPHCQEYETAVGPTLDELVATGEVAVVYHPIRVVTNYGNRAGSAATCVAEGDPDMWPTAHAGLFALHDATTDGWSNDQLRDYLVSQGVTTPSVLECVEEGRYENWIDANTDAALAAGVTATPTLMINGERSEMLDASELRRVVEGLLAEQ
ncbi:DsbA family protein [Microbacterium sp. CFBP 8794]|uniref:DsbA family protein n=1 Tax=Microbacterium sp. CFBP 8794 TaxID=2775269 RepID=UPI0017810DAA|nr:thioredoxin domain-containing protein [Microbacterium sp. CFBP 8794]MBD8478041.1 thioredoxin domain-containing protein [Microbacterium sp. CFBP 8794]